MARSIAGLAFLLLVGCGSSSGGTDDIGATPRADTGSTVDASKSDTGSVDTGAADAGPIDTGSADTGTDDAGLIDSGATDTGAADASPTDTGAPDTGATDTGPVDSGIQDAAPGPIDAATGDAGPVDSGIQDAGPGSIDAGTDAGRVDSGIRDTGPVDAGTVDAGLLPDLGGSVDAGTGCGILGVYEGVGPAGGTMVIWFEFMSDGSWVSAATRAGLSSSPTNSGTYGLVGARFTVTDRGGACGTAVGSYDVVFGANCSAALTLVSDTCGPRAGFLNGSTLIP
ncbi:MAG: hypothetical protein AAFZ18_18380 [Myxococcota bacterium]